MKSERINAFARPLSAAWKKGTDRFGAGGLLLSFLLIALIIGSGGFLMTGENPWDRGVPDKLATDQPLTIKDTIVSGLWIAAGINLVLSLLLLISVRWWSRPLNPLPALERQTAIPPRQSRSVIVMSGRLFTSLVLLAVVTAAVLRAPRLDHSFINDEEQAFRKFTWGAYTPVSDQSDELEFAPTGWDRALFYSMNGNNHVVHTMAAKLSHSAWRWLTHPEPENFRERVIRLEPFISGLLAIIALASWLRLIGLPVAGVGAAWLMALHPWILRYAVEARGYSALLLFICLAMICLTLAFRTGRWRWWLAYGICQCLYLLCFAGAVYLAVAMNAFVLGLIALTRDGIALRRWLVSCVLGAMVFLQMMTAAVLRLWKWIDAPDVSPLPLNLGYLKDYWGHLTMGAPWAGPHESLHLGIDITTLMAASPFWGGLFRFGLPLLLVIGVVLGSAMSRPLRLVFGILSLTAGLIWLHNVQADLAFFSWYSLYFVLGFIIALAVIPEAACARILPRAGPPGSSEKKKKESRLPAGTLIALATSALIIIGYSWLSHEVFHRVRNFERHPMRTAVTAIRGEAPAVAARHASLLTGALGSGANQIRTYDPRVRRIQTVADLDALVAEARETQMPLSLYVCGPRQLANAHPELAARLEDTDLFSVGDYLPGLEEFWSFRFFHLKP